MDSHRSFECSSSITCDPGSWSAFFAVHLICYSLVIRMETKEHGIIVARGPVFYFISAGELLWSSGAGIDHTVLRACECQLLGLFSRLGTLDEGSCTLS